MKNRQLASRILFILALPVMLLALIDPLEGGLALILAFGIYAVAILVAKQKPSKLLWIPFLTAFVIGAFTLALAIMRLEFTQEPQALPGPVVFGLWAYRAAVLVTLAGAVVTVVNSFKTSGSKAS